MVKHKQFLHCLLALTLTFRRIPHFWTNRTLFAGYTSTVLDSTIPVVVGWLNITHSFLLFKSPRFVGQTDKPKIDGRTHILWSFYCLNHQFSQCLVNVSRSHIILTILRDIYAKSPAIDLSIPPDFCWDKDGQSHS